MPGTLHSANGASQDALDGAEDQSERLLGEDVVSETGMIELFEEELLDVPGSQARDPEAWAKIRRGWCLVDEDFRRELLERVDGGFGEAHYGSERKENQMQRAERIIAEELKSAKWRDGDLADSPKIHPVKADLAVRLRRETTLTCEWIARRLHMGAVSTVSNLVYATRRTQGM